MHLPHPSKKVLIGSAIGIFILAAIYYKRQRDAAIATDASIPDAQQSLDQAYQDSMSSGFGFATRPVPYQDYPQYPQYPSVSAAAPAATPATPVAPVDGDGTPVGSGGGVPAMTPANNVPLSILAPIATKKNPSVQPLVSPQPIVTNPNPPPMVATATLAVPVAAPKNPSVQQLTSPQPITTNPNPPPMMPTAVVRPATTANSPTTAPVMKPSTVPVMTPANTRANSPTTAPVATGPTWSDAGNAAKQITDSGIGSPGWLNLPNFSWSLF